MNTQHSTLDGRPIESELKLRLDPRRVRALLDSPQLKARATAAPATGRLKTLYYDSPDQALRRHGTALRMRRVRRRWIQSVKAAGEETAGLHRRSEVEQVVPGPAPQPELLPGEVRAALDGAALPLAPVFATEVRRTVIPLSLGDGQEVELALDRGRIKTADAVERICEAELEVKLGPPSSAFALALELLRAVPFVLEHRSKAERGYALLERRPPAPRMALPIALTAEVPANLALANAAAEGLRHMGANEAVARAGGQDIEGVHQMRVGLRRLNVALSLANKLRPDPERELLRAELSWIGDILGKARDLDVFIAETLDALRRRAGQDSDIDRLAERAAKARAKAYDALRAALDSPRYTEAQLRLGAWIAAFAAPTLVVPDYPPLGEVAGALLNKRHRQIRKFARRHGCQSKEELHALRLHAKKLRYSASFFAPLFARKRTRIFIARLAELQDMLGMAHDSEVARTVLAALGTRPTPEAPPRAPWRRADALVEGWHLARGTDLAGRIDAAWQALSKARRFW
jgi:inorganic triphosphatase YgiF